MGGLGISPSDQAEGVRFVNLLLDAGFKHVQRDTLYRTMVLNG
jgi:hypothetical protein